MNYFKKLSSIFWCISILTSFGLIVGCGNPEADEDQKSSVDSTQGSFIKAGNAVFSIPSPIQTSLLIKKSGANYDKALLNAPLNLTKYTTNFKKALNLGIYGADLGYISIYDQTQDALAYLSVVRKLSEEMGVAAAFDGALLKRFEANLGKKDSLIMLVSDALRASNNFLQNNERTDAAGLIIAGGWLESLHFSIAVAKATNNQDVINRIGEQKSTLENLIKLLTPSYEKPEYTAFLDALIELAYEFDAVEIRYTYIAPTVDAANKITTVNSTSEVIINTERINNIANKVAKIRQSIIE